MMSMNGAYSSNNQELLRDDRYQKYVRDADSKRVLISDMKKKYDDYVSEWYWVVKGWDGIAVLKDKFAGSGEAGQYAFQKLREEEAKPNEADLDSKAISVTDVNTKCDKYEDLIEKFNGIYGDLEVLKEKLGANCLSVNKMNFELRIDEIIDKIKTYKITMQEFVDEVRDRSQFVHDFQVAVQKDYIRYYGNESSYGNAKTWNRERDGWDI